MYENPPNTDRLKFKAFLSHAYKAEEINIEFFEMFDKVADVQFEVDIGLKNLNVTRLERRIRDCDAFVGIYPYPGDSTDYPTPEETMKASRYFRLEIELAARARLPSIIFYDNRFQPAIRPLRGIFMKIFQPADIQPPLRDKLGADIRARAAGLTTSEYHHEVGLLVPRGKGGYGEQAIALGKWAC